MICPQNISSSVGDDNCKRVPKFPNDIFATDLKALNPDGHITRFKNINLALLLQHN